MTDLFPKPAPANGPAASAQQPHEQEGTRPQKPEAAAPECRRCRPGKETFWYLRGLYEYDVDRARAMAADGREAVEVEEESARASVDESELDETHVDHVDPSIP